MSPAGPGSDRLGTLGAAALALLGLAAFDVLPVPLLPRTAVGFLQLAVPLLSVLLLAGALAAERPRRPGLRALTLLLAASPALVAACCLASGGSVGVRVPGLGLLLAPAVTLACSAAPMRVRRGVAALLLAAWGVDTVLATARIELLPAELNPVRTPLVRLPGSGRFDRTTRVPLQARAGPRPGAYVRERDARFEGPWYVLADEGPSARATPLLCVLGSAPVGLAERFDVASGPAPGAGDAPSRVVVVLRSEAPPRHPYDLGGAEVVAVARDAWAESADAPLFALVLARYARQGGRLVVLGDASGPPGLEQALRPARAPRGVAPPLGTPFGLGSLWHADDEASLRQVVARALERPLVTTAFDLAQPPPPPPDAWKPVIERGRLPLGLLLVAAACAVGLLEGAARTARSLLALLLVPVLALWAGVALLLPQGRDLGVGALTLELGGPGGRRIEALWLEAGERGYAGDLHPGASGLLRHAPGGRLGSIELAPDSAGWVVIEREAGPADPRVREDRRAGWLRSLLLGEVAPARLRFVRGPAPGLGLEGVALPEAWGLELSGAE